MKAPIKLLVTVVLTTIVIIASQSSAATALTVPKKMSKHVINRIAVVTGANKGIGYAIAVQLAQSGHFSNVILGCRDETRGQNAVRDMVNELKKYANGNDNVAEISFLPLTIGVKSSHESFRKSVQDQYQKVDVLVNNAGMAFKGSDPTPFAQQCKPTLDVNFRGTFDFTEELLPLVRKGNDPRIVNVASMAGRLGQIKSPELRNRFAASDLTKDELHKLVDQFESDVCDGTHKSKGWGGSNYGFSKLALIAMTRVWAREEMSHHVKVNCCCPGYCDTDMTSHKGRRTASDGAGNAVLPATMEDCPTGEYFADFKPARWV